MTVIGNVPVCVGVPERTPVDGLSVIPVGSVALSDQVIVPMPPDWLKVWENATPAVPELVAGFVTVMTWQTITRL